MSDHEGHTHEWRGQGTGQTGDSGVSICREHPDGRIRIQRRGYLRPLPGGGRGWVEEPCRTTVVLDHVEALVRQAAVYSGPDGPDVETWLAARAAGGRALRSHLGWLTGVASELGHAADEALSLIITLEREGGGL